MSASAKTTLGILGIVVVVGVAWLLLRTPGAPSLGTTSSTTPETTSDGTITFARPTDFALATSAQQLTVHSYIPPCDEGFQYCLFYIGDDYQGTNFESAGIAIRKRSDLGTTTCLSTKPAGYENATMSTLTFANYAISKTPTGEGAAGHVALGEEYRLLTDTTCYQIDLRVGQSQFANYPTGTIKEFTAADQTLLLTKLRGIVKDIRLNATQTLLTLPE